MARAGLFLLEHNLVFSSILRPLPRPTPKYLRTYAPARTYTYTHARVPPKKQSCPRSIRRPLNRLAASLRTANDRCPCPRASSLGRSSAFVQPRVPILFLARIKPLHRFHILILQLLPPFPTLLPIPPLPLSSIFSFFPPLPSLVIPADSPCALRRTT